jgi:rhodanese-related sulfurtransferase
VAQELLQRGYLDVYPLEGGMDAWAQVDFPLERK